jgi:hypothetical protein
MAALPEGIPALNGGPLRPWMDATASVPAALLTDAGLGAALSLDGLLVVVMVFVLEVFVGVLLLLELVPGFRVKEFGVGVEVEGGFILWPISIFKLLSSALSSRSRLSVLSFWPSIALGMRSLSPRTSSVIRWDSSSLLLLELFNSLMTASTSVNAVSSRSVRACSDAFRASVSFESCSRRVNAFSKESSIACLSCSSWGGVGGAIRGIT